MIRPKSTTVRQFITTMNGLNTTLIKGIRTYGSWSSTGKNPQAAADGPHMAKAAAACGVLQLTRYTPSS